MGASFTHLHLHTEFSMLDGAARVADVIARAAADGQPAIGITDHGNMYGVLDFYKAAREAGIKPIIGIEAYMAAESRFERPVRRGRIDDRGGDADAGEKLYYHLTLLAENDAGYNNLLKLSSDAYLEGYFYKPRCDWELLERYHEGIIATTGCLGGRGPPGPAARATSSGPPRCAARLQDIFGRDNLFVELQDHGLDEQRKTNPQLVRHRPAHRGAAARHQRQPLHARATDAVAHDALLCVQTGLDQGRPEAVQVRGRRALPEDRGGDARTCSGTTRRRATTRCGSPSGPTSRSSSASRSCRRFPGRRASPTPTRYLRHLTYEGAAERYGEPAARRGRGAPRLRARRHLRHGLLGLLPRRVGPDPPRPGAGHPGRARAGQRGRLLRGLLPAHRRPRPDPLRPALRAVPQPGPQADARHRHGLRRALPRRDDPLRGRALRLGPRGPDRHLLDDQGPGRGPRRGPGARLPLRRGRPHRQGHAAARDGPGHPAVGLPRGAPEVRTTATRRPPSCARCTPPTPTRAKVVDVARGLEGLRRQDGIHAAAVVISGEPLTEYLPIQRKPEPGGRPEDAPIVTQYEMHGVEDLGLLKMDFLGLRNLSVIERTLDLIEAATGERPDIDHVALDDPADATSCCSGATPSAIFQLEGGPMRGAGALARPDRASRTSPPWSRCTGPGPMAANMHNDYADRKNGRKPVTYQHPDMEEVLGDTYGLMIYQEQMMLRGPEVRRLLARGGRQPAQGGGQEGPRDHGQGAGEVRRRVRGAPGYGRAIGKMLVRHHRAVRRLRASTRATPSATASSATRRPG